MKTLTRSSVLMTSGVGPSRLASTGVRVFVSARWTLRRSSGVLVSSGPGRGACIASLIGDDSNPACSLRVRLLQTLRDLLHPAQLGEPRAAYHHPACEREPGFERSRDEAEPGRAGRVDLWPRPAHLRRLGVQVPLARAELDRGVGLREAQQ